jgi:CHAT domain-containing protein/tetratricopeptide (TPR) repeat protein
MLSRLTVLSLLSVAVCATTEQKLGRAGESVEATAAPSRPNLHKLRISAGQFVFVQAYGIRMSMRLLDPAGVAASEPGRTAALIASQSGEYSLEVQTLASTAQRYRVSVLFLRESQPADALRIAAIAELTEGYRRWDRGTAAGRLEALQQYQRAQEISREAGDRWLEARCVLGQGNVYSAQGDTPKAIERFGVAAEVYRAIADRSGEATALNSAALLHAARSEHETAFDLYRRALELRRATKDRRGEAEILRNVAIAHNSAGNYQAAVETYEDVLERFRAAGDRYAEAVTMTQMGEFYLTLGDYEKSSAYGQRALAMHRANEDRTAQVHTVTNLGEALAAQGRHSEALVHYNAALELSHASGLGWQHVSTQSLAGVSEEALGRSARAYEMYTQALAPMQGHGNRDGSSRLLSQLGMLELKRGNTGAAAKHLAEAHELSRGVPNRLAEALALTGLAHLARQQGDRAEAGKKIDAALEIVEDIRTRLDSRELKATFLATRGNWWEFAVDLRMEMKDVRGALAVVERSRARSLLDLLAEGKQKPDASPAGPAFREQALPQGTAVLEYALGAERSWLFVVTREGVSAKQLPGAAAIARQVREIRSLLGRPGRASLGRYSVIARSAFQTLVGPAEETVRGKQRLIVVADGALHYLPFEALLTADVAQPDYAGLPYVVKRWNVSYAPSMSVLATAEAPPRAGSLDLLAFGDPRGDLPGAAREVSEISKFFPDARAAVFAGKNASKQNATDPAILQRSQRIHFAAHGFVREGRAHRTGLLLAEGKTLDASEIFGLRLNADLVVLSACETGLGPQLRGEGVLGLTRAFLHAGAGSIAVSLWPVGDDSTVSLMSGFYRRLSRAASTSESLREAKLDLVRGGRYAHPYYWAAFVLTGRQS